LPREVLVARDLFADPDPDELPYGSGEAEIDRIQWHDDRGGPQSVFGSGEWAVLKYRVRFAAAVEQPIFGMLLRRIDGIAVYGTNSLHHGVDSGPVSPGDELDVEFRVRLRLAPGNYVVTVGCAAFRHGERVYLHRRCDALPVRVLPDNQFTGLANLDGQMRLGTLSRNQAA
jgi:hypothetical protein